MGADALAGDPLDRLAKAEVRDLVAKGWLTHDGMWFDAAARALGVAAANALNRAAIRAMAPLEVSRLCGALAVEAGALREAGAVARFVAAGDLVTPESVSEHLRVTAGDGSLHWEWDPGECFAYKGMKRYGWMDGYCCGVIYRIECWLAELGVRPGGEPAVEGCLMKTTGCCAGDLVLSLPS
jgi:Family of unknown function (DUF6125)